MTAADFELLTEAEVECLLRRRLNLFVNAGAAPCAALVLAAQVEIPEEDAVRFLQFGFSVDLTLRLLYEPRRLSRRRHWLTAARALGRRKARLPRPIVLAEEAPGWGFLRVV